MKYLKLFEKTENINKGDFIILLKPDDEDIDSGFKKNEIYEITNIIHFVNNQKMTYPYQISYKFNKNDTIETNIARDQFRLATPEEIIINKKRNTAKGYNLWNT